MNWLVDAQLPRRLATRLVELGEDAQHTLELPDGNATTDAQIAQLADDANAVVISKDRDFVDAHLVNGSPAKLLWVTTGNISNNQLLEQFESLLIQMKEAFVAASFIELTQTSLTIHA